MADDDREAMGESQCPTVARHFETNGGAGTLAPFQHTLQGHGIMRRFVFATLCLSLLFVSTARLARAEDAWHAPPDPEKEPVPKWIWGPAEAKDNETLHFRVTFDPKVPAKYMAENPSSALLWAAGDDDMVVHVNGKVVAKSAPFGAAIVADVRTLLVAGNNVITVRCKNNVGPAGIALKLTVRGQYRDPFDLVTDEHWKVTDPNADVAKGFGSRTFDETKTKLSDARVLGPYGMAPWGKLKLAAETHAT